MSTAVLFWENRWVACRGYLCLLQCCCGKTGGWHVEDMFTSVLLWEDRWVACRGHVYFSVVVGRQVGGM